MWVKKGILCWLQSRTFSPFPTMFSKSFFFMVVKSSDYVIMGQATFCQSIDDDQLDYLAADQLCKYMYCENQEIFLNFNLISHNQDFMVLRIYLFFNILGKERNYCGNYQNSICHLQMLSVWSSCFAGMKFLSVREGLLLHQFLTFDLGV